MVSRQIQDLVQELGFILFTRTRPQVTLTEQGREFYEAVHNVLAGLQQFDSRSREISQGQSRSEDHTSDLHTLMRITYPVPCLKNKSWIDTPRRTHGEPHR